jgi:KipI family sensor histidine kinase inhibitor
MEDAGPLPPLIRDASDHSLLVSFGEEISEEAHRGVRHAFYALTQRPVPGVLGLHPGYASIVVTYDPRVLNAAEAHEAVTDRIAGDAGAPPPSGFRMEIPVCYGGDLGPDLDEVARESGLEPDDVVRLHAGGDYLVYFLGFSPGFPYLGGMSPRLAAPRRGTPRTRVPAGSVAIGGSQTGVYPLATPGGWQVIGRTPLVLFDPKAEPPALLALGDRVHFTPITRKRFEQVAARMRRPAFLGDLPVPVTRIHVAEPGFQTTVQDLGRPGHAHLGVSASGAADALSLRIANRLVGNPEGAAALEMTLAGGTFAFAAKAVIAVCGADFEPAIDGLRIPLWAAIEVHKGQTLACGPTRGGARCYLGVRGGIWGSPVLGSLSTHLTTGLGGFGGRALKRGDTLGVGGAPAEDAPLRRFPREAAGSLLRRDVLRVTRGAQWGWFGGEAWAAFLASPYRVSETSSRMGLRLQGAAMHTERQGAMLTEGVSLGALQVPPDGKPILSFVEHQTTGGYPQIGCVIAADIHRIGQLRPRDEVRFEEVSLAAAAELLRRQEETITAGLGAQAGAA